ncbi:MAG: hypothetical protein RSB78_00330 [Oscillospiraceae bacterium]
MKCLKRTIAAVITAMVLMLIPCFVFAANENPDEFEADTKKAALENAPDSVKNYYSYNTERQNKNTFSFRDIAEIVKEELGDREELMKTPVTIFGLVIAVCLMYSILTGMTSVRIMPQNITVKVSVCIAVALTVSAGVINLLQTTLATIETSRKFVLGFVPVFSGIMISGGSIGSAALYGSALIGLSAAISEIVALIVKPLIGIMIGLSVVAGIYDNGFYSLVSAIKRTVMWILGISTSVFLGLVKLQTIVASKGDSFAFRTSRFIVGSAIPVIGSSVSEALSTVTGGLSVIKSTTGIIGVISLCAIFIPQIINCVLSGMSLYFASVIGEMIGAAEPANAVRSIKSCIDIMIAVLALYFMIIVICTAVMMNVGVNAS